MKNLVCHVLNRQRDAHAQPFVVCPKHYDEAEGDYAGDPDFELKIIGNTDAWCGICYREDRVRRPLLALEYIREVCTDSGVEPYIDRAEVVEHLSSLALALGYKSLEDAYFQLEVLRKKNKMEAVGNYAEC